MSRRVPLHSAEGRRLVEQGPPCREPVEPPEPDEIPWHTEDQVKLSVARMKTFSTHWGWDLDFTDEQWMLLARVALGMRPR